MEQDIGTQSKVVETYAEDMAEVLEDDKSGIIKKIIHEEEEHEIEKRNLSPQSTKNKFFMLVSLLLIALGAAVLIYFWEKKEAPTVSIEEQFTPLIFNDKSVFLEIKDFKKEEIALTVFRETNAAEVKSGGVEGIYLTNDKRVIGLREFIRLINGNFAPDAFSNNALLVNDNFLMGAVNAETRDFFILLKVRSIADVFDALRAWEGKIFFDLRGFFGVNITSETKHLLTANFEDGIIQNKNARILRGADGKTVLMYILADDTSVIITNTENAAREIMLRLAASRVKK